MKWAQQVQLFQKDHSEMMEKLRYLETELQTTNRKLLQEQKNSEELAKRLKRSEERVKVILESNITMQKDHLKITLLEAL